MNSEVKRVIKNPINGWSALNSDWQGVLVGAIIIGSIKLFNVTIPW
jgi:hypothetical protein